MPNSGDNPRFQVLVNGEVRGIAGVETLGVFSVTVCWVRGKEDEEADTALHGLDSTTHEHMSWFRNDLRPGDEVIVRILPPGEYDVPAWRKAPTCRNEPPAADAVELERLRAVARTAADFRQKLGAATTFKQEMESKPTGSEPSGEIESQEARRLRLEYSASREELFLALDRLAESENR